MRITILLPALLAACSPLDNPGVRTVGIDLVPALPEDLPEELVELDVGAIAVSTGRIEAQAIYDDGFIEGAGLPVPPDGLSYYGVLGFAEDPRDELVHDHEEFDPGPPGFAWDAVIGPLRREEDGHTSLLFLASDTAPYELAALRTTLIVVSSSDAPTAETATMVLAGEFEFTETGAVAAGHSHGP